MNGIKIRPQQVVKKFDNNRKWVLYFNKYFIGNLSVDLLAFDICKYRNHISSQTNENILFYLGCFCYCDTKSNRQLKHFAFDSRADKICMLQISSVVQVLIPNEETEKKYPFKEASMFCTFFLFTNNFRYICKDYYWFRCRFRFPV